MILPTSLFFLALAFFLSACNGKPNGQSTPTPEAISAIGIDKNKSLRVIMIDDASGSPQPHGVTPITEGDFKRVLDALKSRGGEVAYLVIDENSGDTQLVRTTIERKPPFKEVPGEPDYKRDKRKKEYDEQYGDPRQQEEDYNSKITKFLSEAKSAFDKESQRLSRVSKTFACSDVWGAFNVGSRFLTESASNAAELFILINSDCEHKTNTINTSLRPLDPSIKVLIVNTSGAEEKVKEIKELPNKKGFTSISSAIDFMLR